MAKAQRAAYGAGSMTEKEPGVWRLRAMVDGKQLEPTFRGTEGAAPYRAQGSECGTGTGTAAANAMTFGHLLDEGMRFQTSLGRAPKTRPERLKVSEIIKFRWRLAISRLSHLDIRPRRRTRRPKLYRTE